MAGFPTPILAAERESALRHPLLPAAPVAGRRPSRALAMVGSLSILLSGSLPVCCSERRRFVDEAAGLICEEGTTRSVTTRIRTRMSAASTTTPTLLASTSLCLVRTCTSPNGPGSGLGLGSGPRIRGSESDPGSGFGSGFGLGGRIRIPDSDSDPDSDSGSESDPDPGSDSDSDPDHGPDRTPLTNRAQETVRDDRAVRARQPESCSIFVPTATWGVVHEATADVELRRITNAVEPVVEQRPASKRSLEIVSCHPRIFVVVSPPRSSTGPCVAQSRRR